MSRQTSREKGPLSEFEARFKGSQRESQAPWLFFKQRQPDRELGAVPEASLEAASHRARRRARGKKISCQPGPGKAFFFGNWCGKEGVN